jgi:hypothetical protein
MQLTASPQRDKQAVSAKTWRCNIREISHAPGSSTLSSSTFPD